MVQHGAPVLACSFANRSWSGNRPFQLCKQGVVGSNPIVSTTKVQVTRILFGRDLRRIARRAHYVPTNGGAWCVIVGTGAHGRLLAEALEVADDVGVLAVDHVLVPERGRRGRVTDPGHERLQARATRSGQRGRGVPQVVEPESGHAHLGRRRLPYAAPEVAAPHRLTVGAREHEPI